MMEMHNFIEKLPDKTISSFKFFQILVFSYLHLWKKMATKETVEELFKKRDTDGDGLLTHSELKGQ